MAVTFKTKNPGAPKPKKVKKAAPASPKAKGVGRAFKRIYDLGDERRAYLNSLFLEGKGVPFIIHLLKNDWGVFTDTCDGTLTKYLYRYKWEVIDKSFAVRQEISQTKRAEIVEAVKEQLDVFVELSSLAVVQKTRVAKLLAREKDMPMLFNSLGGEIKTYAGLLQQYADLSFDLGLLKRVPQITKITHQNEFTLVESEGKNHVMFGLENTRQVEAAAKQFFEVLAEVEDGVQSL